MRLLLIGWTIGAVGTLLFWAVFTLKATRSADLARRAAARAALRPTYAIYVIIAWPVALSWMLTRAIRIARSDA